MFHTRVLAGALVERFPDLVTMARNPHFSPGRGGQVSLKP
jgi:hypothetical protein